MDLIFNVFIIIFAIIFGLSWGSFLNVACQRPQNKKKSERTLGGRSFCDSCKHKLGILDLIPVLSFVGLRGKCRYCNSKIPVKNLIVELTIGAFFGLFAYYLIHFGLSFAINAALFKAIFLAFIFVTFTYLVTYDIWWMEIPLWAALALIIFAFAFRVTLFVDGEHSLLFLMYSIAPIVVMVIINFIYKQQAFGVGDYLIILSLGLSLDLQGLFVALESTILIAAILGLLYAWKIGKLKGVQVPLVPFLGFGWLIAISFAQPIINFIF